jgi:hypothetical protein
MFELLLQADKSLSDGLLDQAERTYWQLIELDPTNAIAVAGLACISLQRGDERLARTFADRALSIDPDNIAARRVIQALGEGASTPAGSSPSDLPLRGAERLEALSRRRAAAHETEEGGEGAGPAGSAKSSARPKTARRSGGGRVAAAAAAAAAAAREPGHARHEPHRAMPSGGRRLFRPEMLKAPPSDPFSQAEMAAAVAAVDALDETLEAPVPGAAEVPVEAEDGNLEHMLDAVDATEPEADWTGAVGSADAAEAAAAAEAVREVADAASPMRAEPNRPKPGDAGGPSDEQLSEEEAEAQALREAMAIVMVGDDQTGETEGSAGTAGREVEIDALPADAGATAATTEPVASLSEEPPNAEASAHATPDAEAAPQKKGLFRRFRGS